MLAATSLGATWASCGSELGVQAVIDRFSQISPKVLFTVDGYLYKNKPFTMLADVRAVVEAVPSIEKVVVVPYASESPDIGAIRNAVLYNDFLSSNEELAVHAGARRPSRLHHVFIGHDRQTQVHGPERRRDTGQSAEGARSSTRT